MHNLAYMHLKGEKKSPMCFKYKLTLQKNGVMSVWPHFAIPSNFLTHWKWEPNRLLDPYRASSAPHDVHMKPKRNAKANPKSFLLQIARIIFANPFPILVWDEVIGETLPTTIKMNHESSILADRCSPLELHQNMYCIWGIDRILK